MPTSPLAGKTAPRRVDRRRSPDRRLLRPPPRPGEPAGAGQLRHQRPSRRRRGRQLQRGAHPGDHAGDLRVPRAPGITGPLFLGADTHAASGARAARPRSRCWPRTASRRCSRATTTSRRRRRCRARSSRSTRAGATARRPGRRHRRDAVAQPAARRRVQVQPAARRPGRHRRHRRDPGARERHPARRRRRVVEHPRVPYEAARRPPHVRQSTSSRPTSRICRA